MVGGHRVHEPQEKSERTRSSRSILPWICQRDLKVLPRFRPHIDWWIPQSRYSVFAGNSEIGDANSNKISQAYYAHQIYRLARELTTSAPALG